MAAQKQIFDLSSWNCIDTVFLDMDGTLLDLHFDDHFWQEFLPARYASLNALTTDVAKEQLAPKFKQQEGNLNWYCVDYWSRELGIDIVQLKEEIAHLIDIHDGVIDFLAVVKAMKKRIVLVTNAHRKALELKMRYTQLDVHFDNIIISHDIGLAKENPGFWERVQAVEPFDPNKTLFVDDSLPVLRNAVRYQIHFLVAIACPSSQRPAREIDEFVTICHFSELIPL
jgi:putative hydrolase of the HAD superfamily